MQEYLIKEYIKKLTVKDIKNYAKKKNIDISDSDALILFTYIKNHYEEAFSGNDLHLIKELKEKLSPNVFKESYKLYLEYKIKYLS